MSETVYVKFSQYIDSDIREVTVRLRNKQRRILFSGELNEVTAQLIWHKVHQIIEAQTPRR